MAAGGLEQHRLRLVVVRVKRWSPELRAQLLRGVGYRYACSCGERSPVRPTVAGLAEWRRDHQAGADD
jgi:hypothetical protein